MGMCPERMGENKHTHTLTHKQTTRTHTLEQEVQGHADGYLSGEDGQEQSHTHTQSNIQRARTHLNRKSRCVLMDICPERMGKNNNTDSHTHTHTHKQTNNAYAHT